LFIDSTYRQGLAIHDPAAVYPGDQPGVDRAVAEETYALPLATVEGVVRLPRNIVARHLGKDAPLFEYGGQKYRFQHLGSFVGLGGHAPAGLGVSMSVGADTRRRTLDGPVTDELVAAGKSS